jgi:hypothetical protein
MILYLTNVSVPRDTQDRPARRTLMNVLLVGTTVTRKQCVVTLKGDLIVRVKRVSKATGQVAKVSSHRLKYCDDNLAGNTI